MASILAAALLLLLPWTGAAQDDPPPAALPAPPPGDSPGAEPPPQPPATDAPAAPSPEAPEAPAPEAPGAPAAGEAPPESAGGPAPEAFDGDPVAEPATGKSGGEPAVLPQRRPRPGVAPVLAPAEHADDPALTTQPDPLVMPPAGSPSRTRMQLRPLAPEPPPVTVSGDVFARYELRANVDRLQYQPPPRVQEGDWVAYRARFGFLTRPVHFKSSSTQLYFEPQARGFWGEVSGGLRDAALGLHQGYLRLDSGMVRFDAGRFEMGYGDEMLIGTVPWNETGRSFDGLRLRLQPDDDAPWVDIFFTALREGSPAYTRNIGENDEYFAGAYAGLGAWLGADAPELDAYVLAQITSPTDAYELMSPDGEVLAVNDRDGAARVTVGARVKGARDWLDYRAETGLQLGSTLPADAYVNRSVFAYQFDAEVGARFEALRVGLEGLIASGDDPSTTDTDEGWDHLYPTAHKFLGLSDVFGIRNDIAGGVLHLAYRLWPELTARADMHVYTKPERDGGYSGSELDLWAQYDIGGGLTGRLLYAATFPAKDAFGEAARTVQYLEIELRQRL